MQEMKTFLQLCGKGGILQMNKQEYNNVIESTVTQQTGEKDSLETIREVLSNMGAVLPQGDLKQVSEGLATDDYMGWRKCTVKEAQEYANAGTAVVAISDEQIALVAANEDEGKVASNSSSVMTLDENTSALAVADVAFYANSRAGTCGCHSNGLFNINNKSALLNDLIAIMGNRQDILSLNTTSECVDIILNYDSTITTYCNHYQVPKQFVQTLLLRELWCVDSTDTLADDAVKAYFRWKEECEAWGKLSTFQQMITPYPEAPGLMREDSSTGIGQMFAWVAIEANNLARSKGLIGTRAYDKNDWHDCKEMWYGLHNNDIFAIAMTTLEMYHCADYVGVNGSLFHCSEKQIKAIFARYNGTDEEETASYGNACYEYYKIFKKYS